MLTHLYIKNFTLIDELDIQLHPGFSVITGETGAGKSIILGAIGLLLGQRADSKAIKQGADRCVIEARFDLSRYDLEPFFQQNDLDYDAGDCIVRRELTAAGKSRAFVNDTPAPLSLLKELGERLVDVHSQHQNLLLGKQDFQLSVVDVIAHDEPQLAVYREAFANWQQKVQACRELEEETERNRQNQEFLSFQFNELQQARLVDGEQEELEQRSDTMTHSEDIKTALYEASDALEGDAAGIVAQLKKSVAALRGVERVCPAAAPLAERMDSCYIELKDVAGEVSSRLEDIDFDPAELESINNRLDRLYDLQKKYRVETVAQLLAIQEDLRRKLDAIDNSDETLSQLREEADQAQRDCQAKADALTALRQKAGQQIEQQMRQRLVPLGMPHVRFEVVCQPAGLSRNGQDKVQFLFSANTSTPLQPVAQVASGGEIARVMLALKAMISGAGFVRGETPERQSGGIPTIIFDEIDTGVSGKIAEQMAHIMAEMGASGQQVISITHLPQIAALGSHHYKVHKEESAHGTTSHMTELTPDQRIGEIAQMLSGSDVTEAAVENARQLLKTTINQ